MIKEIKTTKAYIRCAASDATADKYCPHLQPNKEYKTDNDDYFTVYASLLALLECTRCERSTRILEVVVNDDPEELFPVLGKDAYECKVIKTKDFVPFHEADEASVDSTDYRVRDNMMELYPYEYLDNHLDAISSFYVPSEVLFENQQTCDWTIVGYATFSGLLKNLPSIEPNSFYVSKVNVVGSAKHIGHGRIELDAFKVISSNINVLGNIFNPITDTDVPKWVVRQHILNGDDNLKMAYVDSKAVPDHIRHFAVKNTRLVERDEYDPDEDEDIIIAEQNLLTALELLAHPDKTVRMSLLDNKSLYENYDLSQFVVQILSRDADTDVSERARKAYEKLQCKDRY